MAKEQKDSGNGDPGSTSVKATAKAKNPSGRKPAAKKGTLEIKSLAVTGDRDEGNTSSKETNPNGKVSISNSAANSKQENKRKATEVQVGLMELSTHLRLFLELYTPETCLLD